VEGRRKRVIVFVFTRPYQEVVELGARPRSEDVSQHTP
jgi:hypothetical protein